MTIFTIRKTRFILHKPENPPAVLENTDTAFEGAEWMSDARDLIRKKGNGNWHTLLRSNKMAQTSFQPGARVTTDLPGRQKQYRFMKSSNWRLPFSLPQLHAEEIPGLLHRVNWQKESHDFTLQLNEEYETECDSFLILQALQCALLFLSMMNNGQVPASISI